MSLSNKANSIDNPVNTVVITGLDRADLEIGHSYPFADNFFYAQIVTGYLWRVWTGWICQLGISFWLSTVLPVLIFP